MNINIRPEAGTTRVSLSGHEADMSDNDTYRDTAEMVRAMQDKRYGKEPAYTADVQARVARMGTVSAQNAGTAERYSVLTPETQHQREAIASQFDNERDRQAIAKWERAQAAAQEGA